MSEIKVEKLSFREGFVWSRKSSDRVISLVCRSEKGKFLSDVKKILPAMSCDFCGRIFKKKDVCYLVEKMSLICENCYKELRLVYRANGTGMVEK
jgi:hypothetical protein